MLIFHKGHTDTIQVYSVTVMTHVKALQAGHSSQGTSEPILHRDTLIQVPPSSKFRVPSSEFQVPSSKFTVPPSSEFQVPSSEPGGGGGVVA